MPSDPGESKTGLLARLHRRGVFRVGASYAVIAWLLLQIGDVVLDPFEFGDAAMRVLLIVVALGFPVALVLAWLYELTPTGVERDRQAPDAPRPAVGGIRRYADLAVIGVLVVIVAVLLAERGGMIGQAPERPVVAVLPFANMSAEAGDAFFGEGVADTLIHKLGQLNDLVVLSSQSTFQFKGRDLDLGDVGARLDATVIMTGSVQRSGDALRINARLVDVASGRQLWGDSFDRRIRDVFAIQDQIAASAVEAMRVVLTPEGRERIAENATEDLTAYDAYVIGKARLASRTPQNLQKAPEFFRAAVEQDPDYALAYAGLTEALYLLAYGVVDEDRRRNIVQEAQTAAQAAVRLAPGLGDAWLAKGLAAVIAKEFLGSRAQTDTEIAGFFERAIELSPNHALALKYYVNFCDGQNAATECKSDPMSLMMQAARLDPKAGIIKINIAETLVSEGRDEEAEHWLRESLSTQDPVFRAGNVMFSLFQLERGRPVEVALRNRSYVRLEPGEYPSYFLWTYALMDLGAWNETAAAVELMMDQARELPLNYSDRGLPFSWEYLQLIFEHRLARATGQWETAEALAADQLAYYRENSPSWPQLPHFMSEQATATMALVDMRQGNLEAALARQEAAFPERSKDAERPAPDPLDPLWMYVALLKQAGDKQEAEALLRRHLAYIDEQELISEPEQLRWSRFMAYALLGEGEAALAELERVAANAYHHRWYDLTSYSFDPDYGEVVDSPRFVAALGRIKARAESLLREYLKSE
jgi:TolB-like protein